MSAQHPGSELVARGLLEAAGVPVPAWRLVVLPDDPALGDFRKDFAGALGMFANYPLPRTDTWPGFLGATEIIDHVALYKRLATSPEDKVDAPALLRARLMDLLMGDWDRHRKQWRWAKIPGQAAWVPIPEDRDQAFSRYEGFVPSRGRDRDPRFQAFGPKYAGLSGLTYNGREQDRQLLAEVPRETYVEIAKDLHSRLTDEAIEAAARLLPPEWYAADGPRLNEALRARRDALPKLAEDLYLFFADRPDVYLTDQPEIVEVKRQPNGDVEVVATAATGGATPAPHFRRVFHAKETSEIRLYALGGDDRILVTGAKGAIKLRAVGGIGNDVLDESQGGGSKLSDDRGADKVVKGPGTDFDDRPYTPPPPPKNAPWVAPRDYGGETWGVPWLSWNSDLGFFLGWGLENQRYGFRKHPFSASHTVRAGWAFGASTGRADYVGLYPRENSRDVFGLVAYASGLETLRFYGFGNETANTGDDDFYKAKEAQYLLYPNYVWRLGTKVGLSLGPVLRYSDNDQDEVSFAQQQPDLYGFGRFGQLGLNLGFVLDRRDNPQFPRKGVSFATRATLWPKVWDTEETYGSLGGNLDAYLSGGQWVTLALRAGGRRVFGDYPYRDAAFVGGGGLARGALQEPGFTLRGYRPNRFAGDGSLYGNSDLRLRLGRITLLLPCHVGVFGLFDVGRVFLKGESSDTWHTSYGGGIWISMLNYRNTFSAYVAHSKEDNIFHVGGAFTF
jgi:hypothetical protein